MTSATNPDPSGDPLHDLTAYVAVPRLGGLVLSPDGSRLVTGVSELSADGTAYRSALWQVDPTGEREARRLTRSAKGESTAAFTPAGDLLLTSGRPDPATSDDDETVALWLLPASGGEARVVATRPGGVGGVRVARESGAVLLVSETFPGSDDDEREQAVRKERKDRKVSAVLHERSPVRHWDHDLGPAYPRLFLGRATERGVDDLTDDEHLVLRDLTGDVGQALLEGDHDISPDGRTVVTTWNVPERGGYRTTVVAIDVATGRRSTLADDTEHEYGQPRISPDGTRVVLEEYVRSTPERCGDQHLVVLPLDGSAPAARVTDGWDRWPSAAPVWTPDSSALLVTCDEDGRGRIYRLPVEGDDGAGPGWVRLTGDDATYTDVQVSPDGRTVTAMRTSYAAPAHPVTLDATTPDQTPTALRPPYADRVLPELPGTLTEVETTAADGSRVRAWLCLPHGASAADPAPLLLWIHGGPLGSWNAWSWRWNPWLAVSRGYAVLLPDPALSTGYGLDFVQRGWGAWGEAPYTDLMSITDAALEREDLDATRTAAMGGSFGGYMANWVAGHTDRFDAIVTHASLWALDQFGPTTDAPWYWKREMTPAMSRDNSPHRFVDDIVSPMLVIHGDKDYRVPIGEGLRLWAELAERAEAADGTMPHKFLYFPDENHWILTPHHAEVWYETVFAFLDHHVRGQEWVVPDLLG